MKDGLIILDSRAGEELGFTLGKFMDCSYLWKRGDYIYISAIKSRAKGKGNLFKLIDVILSKGYGIKVPSPSPVMKTILTKKGFVRTEETSERHPEPVEVWVKEKINV